MNDAKLKPFVKRFNTMRIKIGKVPSRGMLIVQKDRKIIMSDPASYFQHTS